MCYTNCENLSISLWACRKKINIIECVCITKFVRFLSIEFHSVMLPEFQ